MVLITEEIRAKAEMFYGDEEGKEKTQILLKEVGLPNGLLPLQNIIECGYVKETGFVWLKQKKKIEHKFEKIGKLVTYGTEVTAYAEKLKIKKLTGVKAKELLVWIAIGEIFVNDPLSPSDKITFKSATGGITRTFPTSVFQIEIPNQVKEVKEAKEVKEVEEVKA